MRRPTKKAISAMKEQVLNDLGVIKTAEQRSAQEVAEAFASLETFVAIAISVFGDINTGKLIEHMRVVELKHYIPPGEKR